MPGARNESGTDRNFSGARLFAVPWESFDRRFWEVLSVLWGAVVPCLSLGLARTFVAAVMFPFLAV